MLIVIFLILPPLSLPAAAPVPDAPERLPPVGSTVGVLTSGTAAGCYVGCRLLGLTLGFVGCFFAGIAHFGLVGFIKRLPYLLAVVAESSF